MADQVAGDTTEPGGAVLGWYQELSAKERRTFWACFAGWALDAMDVQLYSLVIATLSLLWSISRGDAGLLATATLLSSSLGGWLVGILADRFGRVRMLQITILWFSVFTFLCAFATSYAQLFLFPLAARFRIWRRICSGSCADRRDYPQRAPRKG